MPVAGDLLTNVVASFVFEGLRRGYQEFRSTTRRRQSIDRALTGEPTEASAILDKAQKDLAITIGSKRGELSEDVAQFIREVERSSIPEALMHCVLTDSTPDQLYPAFDLIYRSFAKPLPFESRNFFDAFFTAIKARAHDVVKDPAMLEFIQAKNKDLSRQLANISTSIKALSDIREPLSVSDLAIARVKLAHAFDLANRFIQVDTLEGSKKYRIRQLVVHPRLYRLNRLDVTKANPSSSDLDYLPYLSFKTSMGRAVVLGDPGGGKSTLTQLLCYDNSNSIILEAEFPGKPQISSSELRVPFRFVLRSFERRMIRSPGYSLWDYLIDDSKVIFDNDEAHTKRVLRQLLGLGQSVLIFDGLDEVLDLDPRRNIVSLIEQFTSLYPCCPAIVTSRLVGYRDAPMNDDFVTYGLATFNNEEVELFAQKLIKTVEKVKVKQAKSKATQFLIQTNSIAQDLRENPLMLGLMVYLYIYRGEVPSNRPEIYKECSILMFERWDKRRDIISNIPDDFDLLDLFGYIATKVFGSPEREEGVSKDWLISELRKYFEEWYLEKAKALRAARLLVDFITGRSWVMYDIGPKIYKFTHRTFLEYFFARKLLSNAESVSALIKDQLVPQILQSKWGVISHLALQTAVFRDLGKMLQAAETLSDLLRTDVVSAGSKPAFLKFCAETLEYLLIPEAKYAQLISLLIDRVVDTAGYSDITAMTAIPIAISNTRRRDQIAKAAIYKTIRLALRSDDEKTHGTAILALSRNFSERLARFLDPMSALHYSDDLESGYFLELRQEWMAGSFRAALSTAKDARVFISCHGLRQRELFERHGVAAFIGPMPGPLSQMPNLLLETLEDCLAKHLHEIALLQPYKIPHVRMRNRDAVSPKDAKAIVLEFLRSLRGGIPGPDRVGSNIQADGQTVDSIVRSVYTLTLGQKRVGDMDKDFCVLALLICAIILGDGISVLEQTSRRRRDSKGRGYNLLLFMPDSPMESMMAALSSAPLFDLLKQWNEEVGEQRPSEKLISALMGRLAH